MGGGEEISSFATVGGKRGGGEFRETARERNDDRTNESPDYKLNHARTVGQKRASWKECRAIISDYGPVSGMIEADASNRSRGT